MFSMMKFLRLRSLTVRLSIAYALLFGVVTCAGLVTSYFMIDRHLRLTVDADLLHRKESRAPEVSSQDLQEVKKEFDSEAAEWGTSTSFFRLLSASGEELVASHMVQWPHVPLNMTPHPGGAVARPILETVHLPDRASAVRILTAKIPHDRILQIGLSLQDNDRFLDKLIDLIEQGLIFMVVAGSVVGWFMAKRVVSGVEKVTQAAARIAEGHLDSSVAEAGYAEEIERLIDSFNRMAVRIRALVQEMREVNDNIAHDLRSPLTRIRSLAEATLTARPLAREYEEPLGRIVEECDRLLEIVNAMLDISEAEAGVARLSLGEVDLKALANDAVELFRPVAETAKIEVSFKAEPVKPLQGDVRKLQRMIANLVDNAIKYTHAGGRVAVTIEGKNDSVRLSVSDTGMGIPAEEIPKVFTRFYRGDRSRHLPGNGLGLALANAIARAHGGAITVSSQLGRGSVFTVDLPYAPSV